MNSIQFREREEVWSKILNKKVYLNISADNAPRSVTLTEIDTGYPLFAYQEHQHANCGMTIIQSISHHPTLLNNNRAPELIKDIFYTLYRRNEFWTIFTFQLRTTEVCQNIIKMGFKLLTNYTNLRYPSEINGRGIYCLEIKNHEPLT